MGGKGVGVCVCEIRGAWFDGQTICSHARLLHLQTHIDWHIDTSRALYMPCSSVVIHTRTCLHTDTLTHLDAGLQLPHQLLGLPLPERVDGPAGEKPASVHACKRSEMRRDSRYRCTSTVIERRRRVQVHRTSTSAAARREGTHLLQLRTIWSLIFPSSAVMRGAVP